MKHISKIFLILLIVAAAFSGCDFKEIKSKSTIGELSIEVDENIETVLPYLKNEFERLNPEAKINYTVKPTKVAITDFLNKDTKLILVTSDLTPEDLKYMKEYKMEFQRQEIAVDGVGFIVNPDNPVTRVTSDDLAKIFTGTYTEWNQIKAQDEEQNANVLSKMKGNDNKIKVFIQRPNSSTYSYVKDSVLAGKEYLKAAAICSTSSQMLEMIRENKNAIGITNLAWLSMGDQDSLDTTVKTLRISRIYSNGKQEDYTELHQGLVFTRKYPYLRKIIAYTTVLDIQVSTGWITFLRNKDGQKVILDRGLVPITQPVKVIQLD
jgi:phosphate transport system substrate-binding protein